MVKCHGRRKHTVGKILDVGVTGYFSWRNIYKYSLVGYDGGHEEHAGF